MKRRLTAVTIRVQQEVTVLVSTTARDRKSLLTSTTLGAVNQRTSLIRTACREQAEQRIWEEFKRGDDGLQGLDMTILTMEDIGEEV